MRIALSAQGAEMDSLLDPQFGRCSHFLFVDADEGDRIEVRRVAVVPNPAAAASAGAGILAAQLVVEHDTQAVVTGTVGPNAMDVLRAADISAYSAGAQSDAPGGLTVAEALQRCLSGQLPPIAEPAAQPGSSRAGRILELQRRARELRQELAHILDDIERLEKEH